MVVAAEMKSYFESVTQDSLSSIDEEATIIVENDYL